MVLVGSAEVKISPETRAFAKETEARVKAALAGYEAKINLDAETSGLRRKIEAGLAGVTADIELDIDAAGIRQQIELATAGIRADLDLDVDLLAVRRKIEAGLSGISVDVDVDMGDARLRRFEEFNANVRRSLESSLRNIDKIRAEIEVEVEPIVDKDRFNRSLSGALGGGSSGGLRTQLAGLALPGLDAVVGLLGSLTAAAVAAGGAAVGLAGSLGSLASAAAALPAVLGAVTQGGITAAVAFSGMGDALKAHTKIEKDAIEATDDYQAALAYLVPSQRGFVEFLVSTKPRLKEFQETVAAGLLPGVEDSLRRVLPLLDDFEPIMADTGKAVADLSGRFADLVTSPGFRSDLISFGRQNIAIIERMGDAGLSLTSAFRHIGVAAQPLAFRLSDLTANLADLADKALETARADGRLSAFFDRVGDRIESVTVSLGLFGSGLIKVFSEASPSGDAYLAKIERLAARFDLLVDKAKESGALKRFFEDGQPAAEELARLTGAVVQTLFRIGQANFGNFIQLSTAIREVLLPSIERAAEAFSGEFLVGVVNVVAKLTDFFATFIAGNPVIILLVNTLANFLDLVNTLGSDIPFVSDAFVALVGTLIAVRVAVSLIKLTEFITGLGALKGVIADSTLVSSTGRFAGAVALLGKALTIGAVILATKAALDALAPSVEKATKAVESSANPVAEFERQLQRLNKPGLLDQFTLGLKSAFEDPLHTLTNPFSNIDRALKDLTLTSKEFAATLDVNAQQRYIDGLNAQGKATGDYEKILASTVDELARQGIAEDDVSRKVQEARDKIEGKNTALDRYRDKLAAATAGLLDQSNAEIASHDAMDRLTESVERNGNTFDINTAQGRENLRARNDLLSSLSREVESFNQAAAAGNVDNEVKQRLIGRLNELSKSAFPEVAGQARNYIDQLNAVPPSVHTLIALDISDALAGVYELAGAFASIGGSISASVKGAFPRRAAGGRVLARKAYLIGENGPELFVPDSNGDVLPKVPPSPSMTTPVPTQGSVNTSVLDDPRAFISNNDYSTTVTNNYYAPLAAIAQHFGPGQGVDDMIAAMTALVRNEVVVTMAKVLEAHGASPGARDG